MRYSVAFKFQNFCNVEAIAGRCFERFTKKLPPEVEEESMYYTFPRFEDFENDFNFYCVFIYLFFHHFQNTFFNLAVKNVLVKKECLSDDLTI